MDMQEIFNNDQPVLRLSKDLKDAAKTLSEDEARFLVDAYYTMQDNRLRTNNQRRSIDQGVDVGTDHVVLDWLAKNDEILERQIKGALDSYSGSRPIGQWARSIIGIGPVIASGLMSHIDIRKCPTVGHIWRFAGLDPTVQWMGGAEVRALVEDVEDLDKACQILGRNPENIRVSATKDRDGNAVNLTKTTLVKALSRRPFNLPLKTLCWKIGESFIKVSGHPDDVYGKIYAARKALETERNEAGLFADQAAKKLEKFKIGKDTDAYKAYSNGKLPKAHIHARARRYAVKIFLSHYHAVAYMLEFGTEPPKPFAIAHLGHAHEIVPPRWEEVKKLKPCR